MLPALEKKEIHRPQAVLLLILVAVSTVFLLKPVYDNDFFWHLKTGEWIWQHRMLPAGDPFSYTTPATLTPAIAFTLTSYWFSQVALYLAYLGGGMTGIVAVRFAFAALLLYAMWRRRRGDSLVFMALLLLFALMIFNLYLMERPQTVSFACFGFLLLILDRIRRPTAVPECCDSSPATLRHTLMLSATMLVWANSHGGYLVGQAAIVLIIAVDGLRLLHARFRPMPARRFRELLIAGAGGILCSLANPNGYKALLFMLQTRADNTSTQVQEYSSMLEFYTTGHPTVLLVYFAVMAMIILLVLARPAQADLTEAVLLLMLGYAAVTHIRYAAFFAIAAIPLAGQMLSETPALLCLARRALPVIAVITALISVRGEGATNIATARKGAWINDRLFPVQAADFIIANRLSGNMYNDYDWGGYLIWRLAPERQVFADGRNLNPETLALDYQIKTARTGPAGDKVWKQLLLQYGVNYIITASRLEGGAVAPLTEALLADPDWAPVFLHRRSRAIIFVRNTPENRSIIARAPFGGV